MWAHTPSHLWVLGRNQAGLRQGGFSLLSACQSQFYGQIGITDISFTGSLRGCDYGSSSKNLSKEHLLVRIDHIIIVEYKELIAIIKS